MDRKKCVEMVVAGLVLDPASNAPIVLLKDPQGDICLPIWIGVSEATAIAAALKEVEISRPMTHDLLKKIVENLGGSVNRIFITDLKENTFFAEIEVNTSGGSIPVDSRPSDAIALAVRFGAEILVAREVLGKAQVTLVSQQGEGEGAVPPENADQAVDFANIEREEWSRLLAEMVPEDFKYKM